MSAPTVLDYTTKAAAATGHTVSRQTDGGAQCAPSRRWVMGVGVGVQGWDLRLCLAMPWLGGTGYSTSLASSWHAPPPSGIRARRSPRYAGSHLGPLASWSTVSSLHLLLFSSSASPTDPAGCPFLLLVLDRPIRSFTPTTFNFTCYLVGSRDKTNDC
jgi:hypothetical protein